MIVYYEYHDLNYDIVLCFQIKVTFREPDAAMRACVDPAPVIDGRRANCNLASLGAQRSKPSTPKHGTYTYIYIYIHIYNFFYI